MRFQEPGLEAYLKEINQDSLLTAEEEQELARRISRDDHQARNEMVRRNLRLVVQIANKSVVSTMEAVANFSNILSAKDVGIYISFGGFANDLKESPLAITKNEIRLIDLEKFVNLWVENQDKIDQENRSKFPLKPIYFLSFPEHI